ncbi:3-methyl-2-oxobutanoate hydroxymethyltransferase [Terribacillus sp. DMT04]|uniref:3-methyl-2-oxobutanoate hydroxymethyltransferase n=1 Tax=Terribacillus sp. DMT04 TaxID=2850441 RepID=UPI001C2C05D8|nr:3-methyl-2-oxobutanoate hydroxymethyltransferase [Terribacillus sp. DMT04]QXE00254.1 3-methyl-2-oxobutanoate hydroxymethyltransferase [Terribacillus sp. DMT04]
MKTRLDLQKMKETNEKITMVTAYDYPTAKLAQQAGMDMLLVGDSLGMVVLGYESTIPVTVEDMIHHGKAVTRGGKDTFVVVDMPFMSYHVSVEETIPQARRIFQETGAQALKLEGAEQIILNNIKALAVGGIPVVGHLGLTPQSVHILGGYKVQGKSEQTAKQLLEDARKVEAYGAIALVLECVPKQLAALIAKELTIPVIGIGAGAEVDGQVLVFHDISRFGVDRLPKFAVSYADLNETVTNVFTTYRENVKNGVFPNEHQSFTMDEAALPKIGE